MVSQAAGEGQCPPAPSVKAWIFVVGPPRERPMAGIFAPFSLTRTFGSAMCQAVARRAAVSMLRSSGSSAFAASVAQSLPKPGPKAKILPTSPIPFAVASALNQGDNKKSVGCLGLDPGHGRRCAGRGSGDAVAGLVCQPHPPLVPGRRNAYPQTPQLRPKVIAPAPIRPDARPRLTQAVPAHWPRYRGAIRPVAATGCGGGRDAGRAPPSRLRRAWRGGWQRPAAG